MSLCAPPCLSFAGRCLIDKPKQLTDRLNPRGRYLTVAGADRAEDGRLFFACHQKCDAPAALDRRIGHGDADLWPAVRDGGHPTLALVQHRLSRQQRGGMTIGTEAEQRDIEKRALRIESRRAVGLLQCPLVPPRRILGPAVGRNRMNVLRRHRGLGEHRFARHPIIAFGMIVRDEGGLASSCLMMAAPMFLCISTTSKPLAWRHWWRAKCWHTIPPPHAMAA